jgi:hypothetical protein
VLIVGTYILYTLLKDTKEEVGITSVTATALSTSLTLPVRGLVLRRLLSILLRRKATRT